MYINLENGLWVVWINDEPWDVCTSLEEAEYSLYDYLTTH